MAGEAITHLHPTRQLTERIRDEVSRQEQGQIDLTTVRQVAGAGKFRVDRLVDLVPPEWFESAYYQSFYRSTGRDEAIWGMGSRDSAGGDDFRRPTACVLRHCRWLGPPSFRVERRPAP